MGREAQGNREQKLTIQSNDIFTDKICSREWDSQNSIRFEASKERTREIEGFSFVTDHKVKEKQNLDNTWILPGKKSGESNINCSWSP